MIQVLQHEKVDILSKYKNIIEEVDSIQFTGKVERIVGLTIESHGPEVQYGELCRIKIGDGEYLWAEVVGFNKNKVILMPIGEMKGVVPGAEVFAAGTSLMVPVSNKLLGRVLDGTGKPLDGKPEMYSSEKYPVNGEPLKPLQRGIIDKPLSTG